MIISTRYSFRVCYWLLVFLSGCNTAKDLHPQYKGLPVEAAEIVTNKYPAATDLIATTLVPQKIWEINFRQHNDRYISVVSRTQELTSLRQLASSVPDSLSDILDELLIGGGTFSNFREEYQPHAATSLEYAADYEWKGVQYGVRWTFNQVGERENTRSCPLRAALDISPTT